MMRLRERIADWISGGAITMWYDNYSFMRDDRLHWIELASERREALVAIVNSTATDSEDRACVMERIARAAIAKANGEV